MKYLNKLLPILFIVLLFSCGGDESPNPTLELTALDKIQGTWKMSSVTRDNVDESSEFSGFSITFSQTNYTITNGGNAWVDITGSIGNFDTGSNASSFQVQFANTGSVTVNMAFSDENKTLTMSFTVDNTSFGIGRVSGLAGSYVFVVKK